jgi:hypothetical protein
MLRFYALAKYYKQFVISLPKDKTDCCVVQEYCPEVSRV